MNSWDDGKTGNYWSTYKILGGANVKDNYPLSRAVTIKEESVPTPVEQKTQTAQGENVKSTPGFAGALFLVLLTIIGTLKGKRRYIEYRFQIFSLLN